MANRGAAFRRKQRRKQGSQGSAGELVQQSREDSAEIAPPQDVVQADPLDINSAWMPETLTPIGAEKLRLKGMGDLVEVVRHRWLDIRAVKENWPIPHSAKERMVLEALQTALNPTLPVRDRMTAQRLLFAMDAQNRGKNGLPDQFQEQMVTVTHQADTNQTTISVRSVLNELFAERPILDLRQNPIQPGSDDDYAE